MRRNESSSAGLMAHGRARRTSKIAMVVLMLFALLSTACSSNDKKSDDKSATDTPTHDDNALVEEGEPQKGGNLVVGVISETDGWNPGNATWADSGNFVGSTMFEPLGVFTNEGEVVPWIAESWESSEDNMTWRVTIRQGIKTHTGNELTAQDVRDSLWLNATDGIAKVQFEGIVDSIDVIDKYTAEVHLNIPWATFENVWAGISGYVVTSEMINSPMKGNGKRDLGAGDPIGTGPYKFYEWDRGVSLVVKAFDDYWGGPCAMDDPGEAARKLCDSAGVPPGQPNGPFLESIDFRPLPDPLERITALRNGDVNMILTNRAADAAELRGDFQVVKDYVSEKTIVMVDTGREPFDNIHARRALSYATNAQALIDELDSGEGIIRETSPFGQRMPLAPSEDETGALEYDKNKALEELGAYKADTGASSLSFVVIGQDNLEERTMLQILVDQWAEVGIEAEVKTSPQTAFLLSVVNGEFQAAYFRSYGFPEPDFDQVFFSKKTAESTPVVNFSRYTSDRMEENLRIGRQSTDQEARRNAFRDIVQERNENALDIWLFNTPFSIIADKNIHGLNWFRVYAFNIFQPKPWVGGMWIESEP